MKWKILITVLFVTVGCAGVQKPMTTDDAQALRDKRLAVVVPTRPDFSAATPGAAMLGALGAVAMIASGNEIVTKNGVEDPALKISADLAKELSQKLGVTVTAQSGPADQGDLSTIAARHPQDDLLLDVQTVNWSFIYFPLDWSHYRVMYSVRARLIDLKTKRVLAEGSATRVPEK